MALKLCLIKVKFIFKSLLITQYFVNSDDILQNSKSAKVLAYHYTKYDI